MRPSKAGLEGATRVMAKELGEHGIRVNAVAPTVTMTEMAAMAWSDPEKEGPDDGAPIPSVGSPRSRTLPDRSSCFFRMMLPW